MAQGIPERGSPDLQQPDETLRAVAEVSLRLMAGAVPRKTMDQLQRTVVQSTSEFPWQVVTQAVLAEPADPQRLVQQGLQAQRDWLLRGGRVTPGPSVGHRTKSLLARIVAQAIFCACLAAVLVIALLLLKHKLPWFDVYRVLDWFYETFPSTRPR